jgi:hypothetical protein
MANFKWRFWDKGEINTTTGTQQAYDLKLYDNGDGTVSPTVSMTMPSGASASQVQGTAAAGAVSVGNPVQTGGRESGSGIIRSLLVGASGAPIVQIGRASDGALNGFLTPGDSMGSQNCNSMLAFVEAYNGTSYDRVRNNHERQIWASGVKTATWDSTDQINYNAQSIIIVINVTANGGAFSIVPSVSMRDSESGTYHAVSAVAPAITANGAYVMKISPLVITSVSAYPISISDLVWRVWRFTMTHSSGTSVTYSISVNYC